MRIIRLIVCCCFAGILTSSALAETPGLDIAPFGKRCCVKDQHASQVAFDYQEARSTGRESGGGKVSETSVVEATTRSFGTLQ
jgi:hypothetical protein